MPTSPAPLVRTTGGAFAARGQIAVTGPTAVVDRVETDPAHQRRGPGRLVRRALTGAAADRGAVAAVLGAAPEGRALYESAGWRVPAPLTGGVSPSGGGRRTSAPGRPAGGGR
ncbi:hypothetical protein QQY24_02315 [Streptomyces sp. TG1A-8]|uniref:hypothetical protein n=1 Tax=Streptomyces sp. TG1A-8 TaxID=3051385 RepID=UPI00265C2F8A|nr:hypothetical protein [Streptomyces sp. TG1A-8]MDO0924300.1 hypothetical protein [Streptomyces sp. TG1A-8]